MERKETGRGGDEVKGRQERRMGGGRKESRRM